ncbi:hypothetical protein HDU89_006187 [Geranomyces variabilis]|nr:hypothetical protein HDU89_006187 [Geranomyces variabilis]
MLLRYLRRPARPPMLVVTSHESCLRRRGRRPLSSAAAGEYGQTFDKILIANRGEIACRIIKTARKMGIKTVAIYSDADVSALHVRMADEAVHVGPPASTKSYLNIPAIISAIERTGAQAVHPGYGFLSENSEFVRSLDAIGCAFVGPGEAAIAAMGDKIRSKVIAEDAGVSVIPGWKGVVRDASHAVEIANSIGYPVMLKASAGGGGKGMRIAWNDRETRDAFRVSSSEALSSFGDDRMLVEKFVESPRHIEIQLLGDKHGNVVYLPERECSIQRRNQKVIEEAPSPHLLPATRAAMGAQAVALAKSVGYYSAGTCEFLVDPRQNFYFLEMNTRLQVEHPVTETVSGLDLVEQMIRVAAGQRLAFSQSEVSQPRGWAFESRVYAEDPFNGLPCIGTLDRYVEPPAPARCDSGIVEGGEISVHYDPLICKLITSGETREEALEAMVTALDAFVIKGVTHNIPLLREVFARPRFVSGSLSTAFLSEEFPSGFNGHILTSEERMDLVATAAVLYALRDTRKRVWVRGGGTPGEAIIVNQWDVVIGVAGVDSEVRLEKRAASWSASWSVDGQTVGVEVEDLEWVAETPVVRATIRAAANGPLRRVTFQYLGAEGLGYTMIYHGTKYAVSVLTPLQHRLSKYTLPKRAIDPTRVVLSPMPGVVVGVTAREGDTVRVGDELAVVEAMKMQNVIRAERHGVVRSVRVAVGSIVAGDDVLVEYEHS